MSTFYAIFRDPSKGRQALEQLLTEGVPEDDVSLVSGGVGANGSMEDAASTPLTDASVYVGRADDPTDEPLAVDREEPYYARESEVGPGISTGELIQDAAESVDQSTDPQWFAEDSLEPRSGVTQADIERHDLNLTVRTGYPTRPSELEGPDPSSVAAPDVAGLHQMPVSRLGVVMGGGTLATAALDYADDNPSNDEDVMFHHFDEEGVPREVAREYLEAIKKGGAVLAVGLVPGEVEPPLIERVADLYQAELARTFDAPRF